MKFAHNLCRNIMIFSIVQNSIYLLNKRTTHIRRYAKNFSHKKNSRIVLKLPILNLTEFSLSFLAAAAKYVIYAKKGDLVMTELTIEESFTITCLTHTLAFGKTLGSNAVGGRPWEENSSKIGLRKNTKKAIEWYIKA